MLHSSSEAYIYGQNAITHVAHCTALLFSLFSYNRDRVPVSQQVFKQAPLCCPDVRTGQLLATLRYRSHSTTGYYRIS
jgi:hypothetical protein